MDKKAEFPSVFSRLKGIFAPYASKLVVASDSASCYFLDTPHTRKDGKRIGFGGVRMGKAYVSFHLMSVYATPGLVKDMSPGLRKRMQGKSCFNFTSVDEAQLAELAKLTRTGVAKFLDRKYLKSLGVHFQ